MARAGGLLGLDNFLRTHYTASRETAGAIASYLRSVPAGPPARAAKRSAKGDERAQPDDKKRLGAKPGEAKSSGKKSDAAAGRSPEPKSPSDARPADILAPEPGSRESKPRAAGEAKPAERAKSEKSD